MGGTDSQGESTHPSIMLGSWYSMMLHQRFAFAAPSVWTVFSLCACHPCAGAMLIFSVSFRLSVVLLICLKTIDMYHTSAFFKLDFLRA
jgi:hypothetical protein